MKPTITLAAATFALTTPALANDPVVTAAEATRAKGATWTFTVTIRHADEGWDHYANAFTVETLDGEEIARRVLHHPHVDEQPFTRSLSGVTLPDGTDAVLVRAHDSVHGAGEAARVPLSD